MKLAHIELADALAEVRKEVAGIAAGLDVYHGQRDHRLPESISATVKLTQPNHIIHPCPVTPVNVPGQEHFAYAVITHELYLRTDFSRSASSTDATDPLQPSAARQPPDQQAPWIYASGPYSRGGSDGPARIVPVTASLKWLIIRFAQIQPFRFAPHYVPLKPMTERVATRHSTAGREVLALVDKIREKLAEIQNQQLALCTFKVHLKYLMSVF